MSNTQKASKPDDSPGYYIPPRITKESSIVTNDPFTSYFESKSESNYSAVLSTNYNSTAWNNLKQLLESQIFSRSDVTTSNSIVE